MSAQEELAARIATLLHDDWRPAFGREIYTDVLYIDVPDRIGGVHARYYVASLEEAQALNDTELQARIEVALGLTVLESAIAPENDAAPIAVGGDEENAPSDEHQTETALPAVVAELEVEVPLPQEQAPIETVQGASDGG